VSAVDVGRSLGGHPALDFCNTWVGWDGALQFDYLTSYDHLATWSGQAGLLSPSRVRELHEHARERPRAAAAALRRAREARADLYGGLLDPADSDAFARLATAVDRAAGRVRLVHDGGAIGWGIAAAAGLDAPRAAAAWAAGRLVVSAERERVRVCPGHGCGWLFLDRSGRRRWCTMSTCGNRVKVRRFAERRRG
jgi:predicted RNA-binding Zn ribbon-like protein